MASKNKVNTDKLFSQLMHTDEKETKKLCTESTNEELSPAEHEPKAMTKNIAPAAEQELTQKSYYITKTIYKALKTKAIQEDTDSSDIVRRALAAYLGL